MDPNTAFFATYGILTPPSSPIRMGSNPFALAPTPTLPITPPPSPRRSQPDLVRPGLIARLDLNVVPQYSVVHQQPWLNQAASNHPVLVLGITREGLACCSQSTSFGNRTVEQKYANCSPQFLQMQRQLCLPIRQPARLYHADVPVLDLEYPQTDVNHQGYINISKFFFIEPAYLQKWRSNKEFLIAQSVEVVQACMRSILDGTTPIPSLAPGRPIGPLDFRRYLPEELGVGVSTAISYVMPYMQYGEDYAMAAVATSLPAYRYSAMEEMQIWPYYACDQHATAVPHTSSLDDMMTAIIVLTDHRRECGIGLGVRK